MHLEEIFYFSVNVPHIQQTQTTSPNQSATAKNDDPKSLCYLVIRKIATPLIQYIEYTIVCVMP
jgi:hypothetical protein